MQYDFIEAKVRATPMIFDSFGGKNTKKLGSVCDTLNLTHQSCTEHHTAEKRLIPKSIERAGRYKIPFKCTPREQDPPGRGVDERMFLFPTPHFQGRDPNPPMQQLLHPWSWSYSSLPHFSKHCPKPSIAATSKETHNHGEKRWFTERIINCSLALYRANHI